MFMLFLVKIQQQIMKMNSLLKWFLEREKLQFVIMIEKVSILYFIKVMEVMKFKVI